MTDANRQEKTVKRDTLHLWKWEKKNPEPGLTGVGAEHVEDRLHKTQDVLSTRTHFGQEKHQTDASSKLWAQGSTYHVCSRLLKEEATTGEPPEER